MTNQQQKIKDLRDKLMTSHDAADPDHLLDALLEVLEILAEIAVQP